MDKVRFITFAAGEFLDEQVWYWEQALAKHENKPVPEIEKELKEKLEYRDSTNPNYPPPSGCEVWGPQEVADRLNAIPESVYDSLR